MWSVAVDIEQFIRENTEDRQCLWPVVIGYRYQWVEDIDGVQDGRVEVVGDIEEDQWKEVKERERSHDRG